MSAKCMEISGYGMRLKFNIVVHLNTIRLVNDYNEHNESDSAMGTHDNVVGLDEEIKEG